MDLASNDNLSFIFSPADRCRRKYLTTSIIPFEQNILARHSRLSSSKCSPASGAAQHKRIKVSSTYAAYPANLGDVVKD